MQDNGENSFSDFLVNVVQRSVKRQEELREAEEAVNRTAEELKYEFLSAIYKVALKRYDDWMSKDDTNNYIRKDVKTIQIEVNCCKDNALRYTLIVLTPTDRCVLEVAKKIANPIDGFEWSVGLVDYEVRFSKGGKEGVIKSKEEMTFKHDIPGPEKTND